MHDIKHRSEKALPRAARLFLRGSALSLLVALLIRCGREQQGPNGAGVRAANAATITQLPIADTYARGGSYAAQNFGAATELIVREAAGRDNDRQTFLKFDIGGLDGTVTSAKLRMYSSWGGSSSNSVTPSAHAVADLWWTETGLTWNNKPALGSVLASVTYTSQTPSYEEYDVTNYVHSERKAGRNVLALALSNPSVSTVYITGASREAGANPPQLLVVYTPCSSPYTKTRLTNPARTEVTDASGWVATYTDDSYTVTHRGTSRTFSEPLAPETGGTQTVTHSVYVRVLTAPWHPDGVIDHVGIFLGVDREGKHRILNSRNSLNGPTLKDSASGTSPSVLEGAGWMPNGWRSAVRF